AINVFIGNGNIHYQWNSKNIETGEVQSNRVDVTLVGANRTAGPVSEQRQSYFEQYYLASDSKTVKAETFKKVVYKDVYPNIDWVLYMNGDKLEYDFRVHPGGKVADIKLQYDGSQSLGLDKN